MATSTSKILNAAILGCGSVSELYYTPALKELERHNMVRVKSLLDPNPARVKRLREYFPEAAPFQNIEELKNDGIDFAIVASPPQYHAEHTIQLLQNGFPVLCEKPLALKLTDAEAMVAASDRSNRLLAVGLSRRFFPAVQTIRQTLSLGILGKVQSFICHEGGIFNWPVQSASYFSRDTAKGGVLFDIGVHVLDLLIWWWGYPQGIVYEDDSMGGVEANCRITLKFAQGFAGEVRLSRDCPLSNRYIIDCEKGWIGWNVNEAESVQMGFYHSDFALAAKLHETVSEKDRLYTLGPETYNFEQSFLRQLINFVFAIQGIEPLAIPGDEGLASLQAMEYCYQHRSLMPMPWLSDHEYERAQQISFQ